MNVSKRFCWALALAVVSTLPRDIGPAGAAEIELRIEATVDRHSPDRATEQVKAADVAGHVIALLGALAFTPAEKATLDARVADVFADLKKIVAQQPVEETVSGVDQPHELAMQPLPAYRIEPPDLLQVELVRGRPVKSDDQQTPKPSDQGAIPGGAEFVMRQAWSDSPTQSGPVTAGEMRNMNLEAGNSPGPAAAASAARFSGTMTGKGVFSPGGAGTWSVTAAPGHTAIKDGAQKPGAMTMTTVTDDVTFSDSGDAPKGATFTKTGTGRLILHAGPSDDHANNTYSGQIVITDGTLGLDGAASTGAGVDGRPYSIIVGNATGNTTSGAAGQGGPRGPAMPPTALPYQTGAARTGGSDSVTGPYLVAPDGTINLGRYGSVRLS